MKISIYKHIYLLAFFFLFSCASLVATAQPISEYLTCPIGSTLDMNIIVNGDFSAGNTGFTSGYTSVTGAGSLWPAGVFAISHNPSNEHSMAASYNDHTTGSSSGNLMAINGASSPVDVWCETVSVIPGNNYEFSAWFRNWSSDTVANLPVIQYKINGVLIGVSSFTFLGTLSAWSQFTYTWYSGTSTTATICINDQQTAAIGNDFSIDDISFRRCIPPSQVQGEKVSEREFIYPNPSAGHFSIGNVPTGTSIDIYDVIGKKVFSANDITEGMTNEIDLRNQPDGTYFIEFRLDDNQKRSFERIIIQR